MTKREQVTTMPTVQLSGQNESAYGVVCRRFREELMAAQNRRGDGHLTIAIQINSGQANPRPKVKYEMVEEVPR